MTQGRCRLSVGAGFFSVQRAKGVTKLMRVQADLFILPAMLVHLLGEMLEDSIYLTAVEPSNATR